MYLGSPLHRFGHHSRVRGHSDNLLECTRRFDIENYSVDKSSEYLQ